MKTYQLSIGDRVGAYGKSYEIVEFDSYGHLVCRNLNEACLAHEELRTFEEWEVDGVPQDWFIGEGI